MSNRNWRDAEEDWSETDGDDQADDDDTDGDETDEDDADATISCPECRAAIYADLDHCPCCGHWLTDADHRSRGAGLFASRRVRLISVALLVIFVLSLITELFLLS